MIEELKKISNNHQVIPTSRENYYQIVVPNYDLDGDLFEVFFEINEEGINLTDAGTTLMRLSYLLDYETEKRMQLINQVVYSHNAELKGDIIYKKLNSADFEKELNDFIQILIKISTMNIYSRSAIKDLFYEQLDEYVQNELADYDFKKNYFPLGEENPYKVDYMFNTLEKPLFMFGVGSSDKARLTTITCLKLIADNKKFQSLVVFKDLELIPRDDKKRLLNVADKVFPEFSTAGKEIKDYFERIYGK